MSYPEQQIQAQFEAGNAMHEELERVRCELSAALAQNAELVAQVDGLCEGLIGARKWIDERNNVCDKSKDFCDTLTLLIEATPAQHLRDHDAEVVSTIELIEYDAGHLNDFGGGNVSWWHDYIRSELGAAYDFYISQIDQSAEKVRRGEV